MLVKESKLREIAALGKVWLSDDEHMPDCDGDCGATPTGLTLYGDLIYSDCRDDARGEFSHAIEQLMEDYAAEELRQIEAAPHPPDGPPKDTK